MARRSGEIAHPIYADKRRAGLRIGPATGSPALSGPKSMVEHGYKQRQVTHTKSSAPLLPGGQRRPLSAARSGMRLIRT